MRSAKEIVHGKIVDLIAYIDFHVKDESRDAFEQIILLCVISHLDKAKELLEQMPKEGIGATFVMMPNDFIDELKAHGIKLEKFEFFKNLESDH
jgi:predicted metal-dependent phosphotriesterase family hydrolase